DPLGVVLRPLDRVLVAPLLAGLLGGLGMLLRPLLPLLGIVRLRRGAARGRNRSGRGRGGARRDEDIGRQALSENRRRPDAENACGEAERPHSHVSCSFPDSSVAGTTQPLALASLPVVLHDPCRRANAELSGLAAREA